MSKLHCVRLSAEDQQTLESLLERGALAFRRAVRARILLAAHEGDTDREIAEALGCGLATAERTRKRFAQGGLEAALGERPRSGRPRKVDGKVEALIVGLACSQAPEGQARWTLRQLSERVVALEVVEALSHETVRRVLKKTRSSRGRSARGACRP